ncbi:MAG: DUF3990 domain-containing protein, partial [Bacilli bacterium]|nr:DUF3990 domain-containing protein [Bacilli bacterium]
MKLFYGSKTLFRKPTFGLGNPANDYGLGFYLTEDPRMAELWASQYPQGGFVIAFRLDPKDLEILHLDEFDEPGILRWIALLAKHRFPYRERLAHKKSIDWLIRHFDSPINQYDAVIGYRADDSYFNYSLGFVSGTVSLETLAQAMKLGKLGLQAALLSEKAFRKLEFINATPIPFKEDYHQFRQKTLEEYRKLLQKE